MGGVVPVGSTGSIADGERVLRSKVEAWHTFRHVAAAVHVIDAIAEVVPACEHRGSSGRAHGAASVEVHEHGRAVGLRPLFDPRAVRRSVVVREIRPANVVAQDEKEAGASYR